MTLSLNAVVGNASLSTFDVIVIGAGAGGCAVAEVLTRFGQKVLVLEAGPNYFIGLDDPANAPTSVYSNDEVKLDRRFMLRQDPIVEPRTFRASESDGDRTFTGAVCNIPKTVGGAALHADVKTPRFAPTDFQLGTLIGGNVQNASFADWPVQYDALEPFYGHAERAIGVQGLDGADPFAGPRSTPYPMPPGVGMYGALKVANVAKQLGYTAFPFPTAVTSQPYDGRPACNDCGYCGDYGCPTNAKGSPAVTTLRKALLTGNCQLRPETRAIKLLVTGTSVTGVVVIAPDGSQQTLTADRYVLAATAIEDARLLFLSDPAGVGNSSGLVGRNLMFHYGTQAIGIFNERLHGDRGRSVTHAISDFRGVPNDPNHPLAGILELGAGYGPVNEAITYVENTAPYGARLKALMRQSPFRDRVASFLLQAEDAPQLTNRVDLDPAVVDLDGLPVARITYKNHPFETSARDFYSPKLLDLLQAAGAKYAFIAPADDVPGASHLMGTLRMGTDPTLSVCDEFGQFHDVGNLYAADSSLWPTSSGFNPILTIVTMATRIAGNMVFPGSPEKVIV
ncbi:MAG TPA: GMC family oxidoreductase [Polyangiaceae bacterium]